MRSRLGLALPLAAAVLAIGAGSASAATRIVDNTPAALCKKNLAGPYSTIQDAVDAANKNDTIVICQGVYFENVHIATDGLRLQGQYKNGEVIKPSGHAPGIHIDGAKNVQVTKLVIAGPYGGYDTEKVVASAYALGAIGILVDNGATNARLSFNRILDTYGGGYCCEEDLTASTSDEDLDGVGILFGGIGGEDGTLGSGIAHANEVYGYDLAGIAAYGAGSVVNLTRNRVTVDSGAPNETAGIYGFDGAKVTWLANNVANNAYGYYIDDVAPGSQVNSNIATNNGWGFYLAGASGVLLKGNAAVDGWVGFHASDESSGNTLRANKANEALDWDCEDDSSGAGTAGTANTWIANKGAAASPDPICN